MGLAAHVPSPSFSHRIPLLCCHRPPTVREQDSCRGHRPLGSVTRLPGLMHFLAQHVQGHAATQCHLCQLRIQQEKRDLVTRPVQPDDVQRIVAHVAFSRVT